VDLDLDEEPVRAEYLQIAFGSGNRSLIVAVYQLGGNLAFETRRGGKQTFAKFGQDFLINPRAVVESFGKTSAGQLQQIPVAGIIFCQEYQMIGRIADTALLPVESAAWCNVCFDAYYRLDVRRPGLCIELDGAEHIAVVGNRYRFHFQFFAASEQFVEANRPIKQRILAVQMKMRKPR